VSTSRHSTIAHGLYSYQIGGSERVGADLAIEMKQQGHEVVCFAFYDHAGPIREELESTGIACVDLDYTARRRPVRRITYPVEFFRFLLQYSVSGLVVHHATALILCGWAAWAARVRRVVMVEHGLHQLRDRADYRRRARRYCRFADAIVGVDHTIVDYFRTEMGVPDRRLSYIPNAVHLSQASSTVRSDVRGRLGIEPEEFVFLFVGRLQPEKDIPTLLAAYQLVANHASDARHPGRLEPSPAARAGVRLLIAGDGPLRDSLQAQAARLGLTASLDFLGARRDVPELLQAADAFVMTSITEGQPMALVEAMAAGLPCIGTQVGGIPGLLEDGAGIVVPARDPAATAAEMMRLAGDLSLRTSLAHRAREKVASGHSLSQSTRQYLQLLEFAG